MAYDMQAAVTSWIAQELEARAPGEDIGYWVTLEEADGDAHALIYLQAPEHCAVQRIPVPFDAQHVRYSARRALEKLHRAG